MSDLKSKLPDLKELGNMASKLFKDVRNSVQEIINDYKTNHPQATDENVKPKKQKAAKEKPNDKTQDQ